MILDKLKTPQAHLDRDDLSPNQKKLLWNVMIRYGASQGFAYDRFFKEGFREWELLGIDNVKANFINANIKLLAEYPPLSISDFSFYELIGRARLKLSFMSYMNSLGMGNNSVLERFGKNRENSFKPFERIGILAVIQEFEAEVRKYNVT